MFLRLLALSFAVVAAAPGGPAAEPPRHAERAFREYWNGCPYRDERFPDPEDARRLEAQQQFNAILAEGSGAPLADADRAAATDDFRLIWSSSQSGPAVIGAACRFPGDHPSQKSTPLTRATLSISHNPGDCDRSPGRCELAKRSYQYAVAYNRAIISGPKFPYADLCVAPVPLGGQAEYSSLIDLKGLTGKPSPPSDQPRALGEAARRGTLASLKRWIARAPAEIDHPDDFGLTPLAWAAVEGRTDAAKMLIASGADPLAGCAPVRGEGLSVPLRVSLQLRRKEIAEEMLTPEVMRRLKPWPASILSAAVRGDNVDLVSQILSEEHERVYALRLMSFAVANQSLEMIAILSNGTPDGSEALLAMAIAKQNMDMVRQALASNASPNGTANQRQSPLGSAVLFGESVTDQIVRELLKHGASPDSPVQWETGYSSGSQPNTALVGLVANAQRQSHNGDSPRELDISAAQLRALDMLISAGAKIDVTDDNGRPLAVLAAVGRYGEITRKQLSPKWFERLVPAGMNINATWKGGSALDWLDHLEMGDSETARTITKLGGRRIKPLPAGERF